MFKTLSKTLRRFLKARDGGTMTITAVMMPVILGFSGVGLDMTHWYMQKREVQSLVDMTAVEGVHTATYYSDNELKAFMTVFASANGYDASTDTISINAPPSMGKYAGRSRYIEVIVSRATELYFADVFANMIGQSMTVNISARAVAGTLVVGDQCIIALDPTMDRALEFTGTADVTTGCGIMSNSSSSEAIYIGGRATLVADPAQAVGDIVIDGGGTLVTNSPIQSFAESIDDPFESIPLPPDTACDYTNVTVTTDGTVLAPGKYCGTLKIQADDVVFDTGTYVVYDGDFVTNANTSMSGSEITIILTGSSPADIGSVTMNGGTEAEFTAPLSGDYKGILFYQDRDAVYMGSSSMINGGTTGNVNGVFYFPSNEVDFLGGSAVGSSCMLVFGAKVKFGGNAEMAIDDTVCASYGLDGIVHQERVQLVE